MSRRKKDTSRKEKTNSINNICIDINNIDKYINFIYFYKVNAFSILATSMPVSEIKNNINNFIESINNYIEHIQKKGRKISKDKSGLLLSESDFASCSKALSSEELIEMKEFLKSSIYLYTLKTSGTFKTLSAFDKLNQMADYVFRVCFHDDCHLAIVEVAGYDLASRDMSSINREFLRFMNKLRLTYTPAYVLAMSLAVRHLARCQEAEVRLVRIKGSYYTSIPLQHRLLCNLKPLANFYIDLVEAGSGYVESVASKILEVVQTDDRCKIYGGLRNMSQTRKLDIREREALDKLVAFLVK